MVEDDAANEDLLLRRLVTGGTAGDRLALLRVLEMAEETGALGHRHVSALPRLDDLRVAAGASEHPSAREFFPFLLR